MIGKTNAGAGGGHLNDTDALLRVSAPAHSIVTITKGSTVKSDHGHENAIDSNFYDYYFIIHQSQFDSENPWTVTATLGEDSASDTVIIDLADEYDVNLSYRVPAAYQAIEWLETTNQAYFDTGIIPTTTNYTTRVKVQVAIADGGNIFNVEGGYGMNKVGSYNQLRYNYDNGQNTFEMSGVSTVGEEFDIIYNASGGAVIVNGTQKSSNQNIKALSSRQYSILISAARYGASVQYYGRWRYKEVIISERDTGNKLAELFPCYRKSDNVIGFWDTVDQKFLIQLGTGILIAGPDM